MKKTCSHPQRTIVAFLAVLMLAGCGQFPGFPGFPGQSQQQFHPLDSEVAQMAAPQPGGVQPLYCRIGRGDAHFPRGWSGYNDATFALSGDSRVTVPLSPQKGGDSVRILALFDTSGQKLIFCPIVSGPPDKRVACASIYALDEDLAAGIKRTFDVPNAIRGAEITCAYKQDALQKL